MAAPAGLLLAYLIVALLAIHFFSFKTLYQEKLPAVFSVVSCIIILPVPIWTPIPTWAVAVATVVVAGWTGILYKTKWLQSTTVACLTLIALVGGLWLLAVGLHNETKWVPVTIAGLGSIFSLAIHTFLFVKQKFAKA
ncbi:MAG: hypothetical protein CL678_11820 [Bdellovibrionaceae bacterium]|nr:hypothetical protein [Pseudobdellovibrionaceae bacterium]|tara:strand:+ start:3093 stop:3506 length:414 start_codon:yes stop_codon:yes gene_type:complete